MTPEDVLLKAAEVIETAGWHQGYYYLEPAPECFDDERDRELSATAPVCAMGAIRRAMTGYADVTPFAGEYTLFRQARHLLWQQVKPEESDGLTFGVPSWNDDPQRTKEDVVLALKRAAHGDVVAQ